MEQDDLPISTTNTDLVFCNCLDAFDSLGADGLTENEHSIFDLEGAEVSRLGSSEQELFVGLGECHASVISNHGSSLHRFILALAGVWVQRPQSQLLGSRNCELVVLSISEFDIFHEATPAERGDPVWENLGSYLKGADYMPVERVPDEQFAVELVSSRYK